VSSLQKLPETTPMSERLSVTVECYAGRGEQTPRRFTLAGRTIGVADVVESWLAPDHRYFKVRGADGGTYVLRHDEETGVWELTLFARAADAAGRNV